MTRRQQRLYAILLVLSGAALAATLALFALRDTVTFFYTPGDIIGPERKYIVPDRPFRLGGLVANGSVEKDGTLVRFTVTDGVHSMAVEYNGIPPSLFREGQGVVTTGRLAPDNDNLFIATEILAKHDENYMPPELAKALKDTGLYYQGEHTPEAYNNNGGPP